MLVKENDKTDFDSNGAVYFQVNRVHGDTRIVSCTLFAGKDGGADFERTGQTDGGGRELQRHVRVVVNSGRRRLKRDALCGVGGEYILPAWRLLV